MGLNHFLPRCPGFLRINVVNYCPRFLTIWLVGFLRLNPKDCSPLGQMILQYMEDHQLSMTELADQTEITRPGLRAMCLKRGNPTKSNIRKLARVMNVPLVEIYRLVCENKIRNAYKPDAIDFILQGFDTIVKVFLELAEKLPEQEKPSDYELLDKALKAIKSIQE